MSAISSTQKPAASSGQPQQSAPTQPWQAKGLEYYHNSYVNKAADLGCPGVIRLLVEEGNTLPTRVFKVAIFAIVSLGFALVDVIRAVWGKITNSHVVTPVVTAPVVTTIVVTTTGTQPNIATAATSTTTAPSNPANGAKPNPANTTAAASEVEEAEEEKPFPSLETIQKLTGRACLGVSKLTPALIELQTTMSQRLSKDQFKKAIDAVETTANEAADEFGQAITLQQSELRKLGKKTEDLRNRLSRLNESKIRFMQNALECDTQAVMKAAPECFKAPSPGVPQPQSLKKAPGGKGPTSEVGPASDSSQKLATAIAKPKDSTLKPASSSSASSSTSDPLASKGTFASPSVSESADAATLPLNDFFEVPKEFASKRDPERPDAKSLYEKLPSNTIVLSKTSRKPKRKEKQQGISMSQKDALEKGAKTDESK